MSTHKIYFLGEIRKIVLETIALDKMLFFNTKVLIFFLFLHENMLYVLNRSASMRTLLMSTHNICFHGEIRKILT